MASAAHKQIEQLPPKQRTGLAPIAIAARFLGISPTHCYRLIRTGGIPSSRIGNVSRVPWSYLNSVSEHSPEPTADDVQAVFENDNGERFKVRIVCDDETSAKQLYQSRPWKLHSVMMAKPCEASDDPSVVMSAQKIEPGVLSADFLSN